jgi:lipopolysaccharide/colanic/teichoic acid biosynthesis glycosyltransferase
MASKPAPAPVRKAVRPAKTLRPTVRPAPYLEAAPPILRFAPRNRNPYLPWKRSIDFTCALILLILASPVMLVTALLVKWTSRGPAFYTQRRLGMNGRPFTIFKLRTMFHECESLTGPRWCVPGDPRITPLGAFLRKSHLDELPQLVNVLWGDMSLIGPRPERPEFLPELEGTFPRYRERLALRPGITGLAQVQLPPDTDVAGVCHKLACDIYYTQKTDFWLDARLLLCTAPYALGIPFRWSARLLFVPTTDKVERTLEEPVIAVATRQRKSA